MRWAVVLALALSCTPPASRSFNDIVLDVVRTYPTDGSYGYYWPKETSWEGTTKDLFYQGAQIAHGDPKKRSHCCGIVFEVLVTAWEKSCAEHGRPFSIGNLDAAGVHELRRRMFGDSGERRKLVQHALTSMGLGTAIAFEDAQAGDLVQFWRCNGTGHQAVFIEWLREDGKIVGMKYWSSQASTRGIAYRTERFDTVKRDEIYLARVTF